MTHIVSGADRRKLRCLVTQLLMGFFFRSLSSDRDLINAGSKYTALVTYSPGAGKRRFPIGSFAWV